MKPLINLTFASKLESRRILDALMSRCMILGWLEDTLRSKGDLIYNKKIFIRFAINVVNKDNSQSSCRYANPFAELIAIFSLVGQFIVGLSNPAMSIFLNKMLYSSFTVHKHVKTTNSNCSNPNNKLWSNTYQLKKNTGFTF